MLSGIPYLRTFFNFSDSTLSEVVSVSDCLSLLRKLLKNPSKKNKQKSWLERVQVREENWRRSRSQIWDALYANIVVKGFCDVCNEREVVIKCNDCFDGSFCYLCDDITHTSYPLHDRHSFIGGYPEVLTPLETINQSLEIEPSGKFTNIFKA